MHLYSTCHLHFLFYSESICNAFDQHKNIATAAHMQCIYVQHASLELNNLFGYYIFIQQKKSICKAAKNICNECNKKSICNAYGYVYVQHVSFSTWSTIFLFSRRQILVIVAYMQCICPTKEKYLQRMHLDDFLQKFREMHLHYQYHLKFYN